MTGTEMLRTCCRDAFGFIAKKQLEVIASDAKTADTMLLVRCFKDRFLAPARMIAHYIEVIEADPNDKVRDVSVPAKDFTRWGGEYPKT